LTLPTWRIALERTWPKRGSDVETRASKGHALTALKGHVADGLCVFDGEDCGLVEQGERGARLGDCHPGEREDVVGPHGRQRGQDHSQPVRSRLAKGVASSESTHERMPFAAFCERSLTAADFVWTSSAIAE
jgi:hypothetical protein